MPKENRSGIVYQIPCSRCPQTYIGHTGQRLKEHQQAVRDGNTSTLPLVDYICNTGHPVDWNKAQTLNSCPHTSKQCLLKLWMNLKQPSTLNREHLATQPFSNCIYFIIYCTEENHQHVQHNVKESCMAYIYGYLNK